MNIRFERIKEVLKPKAYKDFMKFMCGQTVDMEGIYEDDFMRWFYKQGVVD